MTSMSKTLRDIIRRVRQRAFVQRSQLNNTAFFTVHLMWKRIEAGQFCSLVSIRIPFSLSRSFSSTGRVDGWSVVVASDALICRIGQNIEIHNTMRKVRMRTRLIGDLARSEFRFIFKKFMNLPPKSYCDSTFSNMAIVHWLRLRTEIPTKPT